MGTRTTKNEEMKAKMGLVKFSLGKEFGEEEVEKLMKIIKGKLNMSGKEAVNLYELLKDQIEMDA